MELNLKFDHGLGDCAYFVHILELYRRRGYRINLHCDDAKEIVFAPSQANRIPEEHPDIQYVTYPETRDPASSIATQYWLYNKPAFNVCREPMPNIGTNEELWQEFIDVKLDIRPHIPELQWTLTEEFLKPLKRPIVMLHSMGNTFQSCKNIPPETAIELYKELLDRFDGTLLLLDWDDRVPRMANWRVRHMTDDWHRTDVTTLLALLCQADLLISVDSGPLHLARMTDIPVVGVFPTIGKHPSRVSLPRARSVNIVPHYMGHDITRQTRILYNTLESPGDDKFNPTFIADVAMKMLAAPRYLSPDQIGADVQLQQFVLEWEHGYGNPLSAYNDRHKGFDVLFKEILSRFKNPLVVETGCIREEGDWRGAGYGTYLLGALLHRIGGELITVDIDSTNCKFAKQATAELPCVEVVHKDSVEFLKNFHRPIDVLMLDSMDTDIPGSEMHGMRELSAAIPRLHENSIVVYDDTVYQNQAFHGKGALGVPWLLNHGWRILHSGYQTICVRDESEGQIS